MTVTLPRHATPWLRSSSDGRLHRVGARVRVHHGPDTGVQASVDLAPVVVGTHPTAGLRLTDPAVSGRHLSIEVTRDTVVVRDLGSKNGTRLRGALINEAALVERERLRVGSTILEVEPEDRDVGCGDGRDPAFAELVGDSPAMCRARGLLERVAATDTPVLLVGPSGTGKDTAARALHRASGRAAFVQIDGSLARGTAEAELFGYERGAFTGADEARPGLIASADGGTLYLDQPDDLPLELQTRLLRFLEAGTVRPIGGPGERFVDARVVSSLREDPEALVEQGRLRHDLRHRLEVVRVDLPPLADRPEDIPDIVDALLEREGAPHCTPTTEVMCELQHAAWPGNVRELRNVLQRALLLDGTVGSEDLAGAGTAPADPDLYDVPWKEARRQMIDAFQRDYIVRLLERCNGNVTRAAEQAGVQRSYLHRRMRALGIG